MYNMVCFSLGRVHGKVRMNLFAGGEDPGFVNFRRCIFYSATDFHHLLVRNMRDRDTSF